MSQLDNKSLKQLEEPVKSNNSQYIWLTADFFFAFGI